MQQLNCEAKVEAVEEKDDKMVVYLDQTVFYPQGGGQPYDTGVITSPSATFAVEAVRYEEGRVLHTGHFESGSFTPGEMVTCQVDANRRQLNTRLHSGGHVVDMAIHRLGYDWQPLKGFHFPDGSYVEYKGSISDGEREAVPAKLSETIAGILAENITTEIRFVDREELAQFCRYVPEHLPKDKPIRAVMYGDYAVPCGGTHVAQLSDIGHETIRKIKVNGETIRVSYAII